MLSLLVLVGALVTYKTATALRVIERVKAGGALPATSVTAGLDVVSRTIDYLAVIWPALLFGILISAAVQTFISPELLVRLFGRTARRAQLTGGLAGSPLMLCSCCVAPIFSTVYRDSFRLAPSLALMLSAPSLNPASLVLTFMAVCRHRGMGSRLAGACRRLLRYAAHRSLRTFSFRRNGPAPTSLARQAPCLLGWADLPPIVCARDRARGTADCRGDSCRDVRGRAPIDRRIRGVGRSPHNDRGDCGNCCPCSATHLFEIPIALTLITAGAPTGAAVAVLFAGPAVNLSSLLTVGREAGWKASVLSGLMVWLLAVIGGVIVG